MGAAGRPDGSVALPVRILTGAEQVLQVQRAEKHEFFKGVGIWWNYMNLES
jgi:hypothetical protein